MCDVFRKRYFRLIAFKTGENNVSAAAALRGIESVHLSWDDAWIGQFI